MADIEERCRWAAAGAFAEQSDGDGGELVDLPKCEQVTRGAALMEMLRVPAMMSNLGEERLDPPPLPNLLDGEGLGSMRVPPAPSAAPPPPPPPSAPNGLNAAYGAFQGPKSAPQQNQTHLAAHHPLHQQLQQLQQLQQQQQQQQQLPALAQQQVVQQTPHCGWGQDRWPQQCPPNQRAAAFEADWQRQRLLAAAAAAANAAYKPEGPHASWGAAGSHASYGTSDHILPGMVDDAAKRGGQRSSGGTLPQAEPCWNHLQALERQRSREEDRTTCGSPPCDYMYCAAPSEATTDSWPRSDKYDAWESSSGSADTHCTEEDLEFAELSRLIDESVRTGGDGVKDGGVGGGGRGRARAMQRATRAELAEAENCRDRIHDSYASNRNFANPVMNKWHLQAAQQFEAVAAAQAVAQAAAQHQAVAAAAAHHHFAPSVAAAAAVAASRGWAMPIGVRAPLGRSGVCPR
mmetsp:Transcript_110881/g.318537  ORF Transcript_110881/g.318537 Transcript_110881/m.318537 type:complete len:462 (-) Transcript_110881:407-1792(-)